MHVTSSVLSRGRTSITWIYLLPLFATIFIFVMYADTRAFFLYVLIFFAVISVVLVNMCVVDIFSIVNF